jgi:hypothetical protein
MEFLNHRESAMRARIVFEYRTVDRTRPFSNAPDAPLQGEGQDALADARGRGRARPPDLAPTLRPLDQHLARQVCSDVQEAQQRQAAANVDDGGDDGARTGGGVLDDGSNTGGVLGGGSGG